MAVRDPESRPVKRAKLSIRSHPLGVKPLGNILVLGNNAAVRLKTLGQSLGSLPEELLMHIIQQIDNYKDLLNLGHTCKALYAYTWHDELWKYLLYESGKQVDHWYGSWRRTVFQMPETQDTNEINCEGYVYSDMLFRPFQCSQIDYDMLIKNLDQKNIAVLNSLSEEEFNNDWYDKPFIHRPVPDKPVKRPMRNQDESSLIAHWSRDYLVEQYGGHIFHQEYMSWPLKVYAEYMDNNQDESPLYLFDCGETTRKQLRYKVPLAHIFDDKDYFKLFGDDVRPDYRWLIVGPERSGSGFHKDPNGTSAWNSVITGSKYWIMFPPDVAPPGVIADLAVGEVTAPVSIAEWFLAGFYDTAVDQKDFTHGITRPGETMYVPAGWWHLVVNLEESIAMTGNFVPEKQLPFVLNFLKNRPNQISGFRNTVVCEEVYDMFLQKLHDKYAEVASWAVQELKQVEQRAAAAEADEHAKSSKWDALTKDKSDAFCFGLAGESESESESEIESEEQNNDD